MSANASELEARSLAARVAELTATLDTALCGHLEEELQHASSRARDIVAPFAAEADAAVARRLLAEGGVVAEEPPRPEGEARVRAVEAAVAPGARAASSERAGGRTLLAGTRHAARSRLACVHRLMTVNFTI